MSITADRLAAAARAQTGLVDAAVSDPRPAWEDRVPDIWGVTVSGDQLANAFLRVAGDRIAVPAGPAQAARELRELGVLDGEPWDGGLIYIVTAVGGATPGFPDTWTTDEAPLGDGGVRITVHMSEAWVAYAAAGGVGMAPPSGSREGGTGGLAPPVEMATATLDVTAGYGLSWRYQLGGRDIEGPAAEPASAPPALSDDRLVAALAGARRRAAAPRAMPAAEPIVWDGHPEVVVVDLWALGPVYVGDEVALDWAAPAPELVALLSAADALPPGIVPGDLGAAQVADGELSAELPAALVAWAAGGARGASPRIGGLGDEGRGRVRMRLGAPGEWSYEAP